MRTPSSKLYHHTATVKVPVISESSTYLVDTISGSYTDTTGIPCRVQESSSENQMIQQRMNGAITARGTFPPGTTFTKDARIVVTGPGYPSGGKTFKVSGVPVNSGGAGSMLVVELEYES